jgi:hypothetical protein
MKLSWRKIGMGPVTFYEPKNSHSLRYTLKIREARERRTIVIEYDLRLAPKEFDLITFGRMHFSFDLNKGKLVLSEPMPEGRNITETKRAAKRWHDQLLKYGEL